MRVGITLPQFRAGDEAVRVARRAEAVGLDGVFAFDHLWPLGRPDHPALHGTTLLGALVGGTERVVLGTLVARVGLVPDAVLAHTLHSLHRMAPGRFVAGLGSGDRHNRAENAAYGIPFPPAAQRVAQLARVARTARDQGVRVWIGGLSAAIQRTAVEVGDGWNGWGLPVEEFAAHATRLRAERPDLDLTWAGQILAGRTGGDRVRQRERFGERPGVVTGGVERLAQHLRALAGAGAAWAICAPLDIATDASAPDLVAEAAAVAGVR